MSELTEIARKREDIAVGDELVRHRLSSRVIHWSVALTFFLCLLSGLPIWTPIFGWTAALFGGLAVCRWLHPWVGVLFFVASLAMFMHWVGEMKLEKNERGWLGPQLLRYFTWKTDDSDVGKYNGGQKVFFFFSGLGALLLLVSGLGLWFPLGLSQPLREASLIAHDLAFIVFFLAIIVHIYLGTAAEPGTFRAMVRGSVTKTWARFHHPRWFREVTGEEPRR